MKHFCIIIGLALCFMGCAQEAAFEVDVVIAANQTSNPILDISAAFQAGQSRGVYFLLDALSTNPTGINDTLGEVTSIPELTTTGRDPAQNSFSIDPALLSQGVFYRLRMVAFDSNGTQTHVGTSDCPIFLGLSSQEVKICFGTSVGNVPACGGLTSFACCEGMSHLTCNQ
ncbi:MAG: hypothetical protein KDK51_08035 [Deltaproteobacteria bacterium]|nr:hypothetical protein [Deltaproteobacteria bacterium]